MFDLDSWTAAARGQLNNSVLLAVPASSKPLSGAGAAQFGFEAIAEAGPVGAMIGGSAVAFGGLMSKVRRFRARHEQVGERNVNDRVVLIFYPDRVDLHSRGRFGKSIGDLHATFLPSEISRPEMEQLVIGDTTWTVSVFFRAKLGDAFTVAGIPL